MARIVFHSAGYWGDVMPYVPIANALASRGHDVTYAIPKGHHAILAGERFAVADSGNPFSPEQVADDEAHDRLVGHNGMRFGGALTGRYFVHEWVLPYLRTNVDALLELGARTDLFVTHPMAAITTRIASDELGVPMLTGHLFPMILDQLPRFPGPLRRAAGLAVGDVSINALRREHGLASIAFNATTAAIHDDMLLLWSERFAPPQPRWSPTWRTTGFTRWEGPAGREVDPAITAYLDAGAPPVVVTLGSSSALVGGLLFETIATRLDDIGQRALFLTGRCENLRPRFRERPDVFEFAPLSSVFPRARAIVHSGGFGTVAAVMHAGVPSVGLPFLIDQLWNARRLADLGAATLVPRRRRTERLWDALDDVLHDASYADRARAIREQMADDDGVGVAVDAIERRVTSDR